MTPVFLDTAYAVALATPQDQHHDVALRISRELDAAATPIITTQPVLLEIGNSLARLRYRMQAIAILLAMVNDPRIEVIRLTDDLYAAGLQLFQQRPDKEWGLIDCISFVVMKQRGLHDALTTDEHFEQAGFRAMLRSK